MRKSASQFSSICRLLTLLLILLACFLDASPVSATYSPKLNIEDSNYQLSGAPSLTRRYKLWNRCSEKFVRIKFTGRRGIDAKGKKTKKFTTILITSIGPDRVLIQGEESHQFLCFNKRGRIRARHKPRKENCNFIQNLTPSGFVNFRLEGNELWYVGFRKKSGKPLPGFRKIPGSKMESCYDFDLIPLDEQRPRFDFRNLNIPVKEQHKKRHYKKRKPRRRKNRKPKRNGINR